MNFYSVCELETMPENIYENIRSNGEAVITNNGEPAVLMIDITNYDYESIIKTARRARALAAVETMRKIASENGYMTDEEIEAEIRASRLERKNKKNESCN